VVLSVMNGAQPADVQWLGVVVVVALRVHIPANFAAATLEAAIGNSLVEGESSRALVGETRLGGFTRLLAARLPGWGLVTLAVFRAICLRILCARGYDGSS